MRPIDKTIIYSDFSSTWLHRTGNKTTFKCIIHAYNLPARIVCCSVDRSTRKYKDKFLRMKPCSRLKRVIRNFLPVLVTHLGIFLLSGCSITGKQSSLDPKGPLAQNQMDIFMVTVFVSLGIFVVVAIILVWVIIRFREKPEHKNAPLPKAGHGNPLIEIGLIVASVLLLVIIAVPTLKGIWLAHELPEDRDFQLFRRESGRG